jgi:hypothetical protein
MSSYHQATYVIPATGRQQLGDLLFPALVGNAVRFLWEARRFFWEDEFQEFSPDISTEIEGLESFTDVFADTHPETRKWPDLCLELQFLNWFFEGHLFHPAAKDQENSPDVGISLSFPDGLFKAASKDTEIATRWLKLQADVALAVNAPIWLCGPEVPIAPFEVPKALSEFRRGVQFYKKNVMQLHTAGFQKGVLDEETQRVAQSAGFNAYALPSGYLVVTLLTLEEDLLAALLGSSTA